MKLNERKENESNENSRQETNDCKSKDKIKTIKALVKKAFNRKDVIIIT